MQHLKAPPPKLVPIMTDFFACLVGVFWLFESKIEHNISDGCFVRSKGIHALSFIIFSHGHGFLKKKEQIFHCVYSQFYKKNILP